MTKRNPKQAAGVDVLPLFVIICSQSGDHPKKI
jgi:hypothetical protein